MTKRKTKKKAPTQKQGFVADTIIQLEAERVAHLITKRTLQEQIDKWQAHARQADATNRQLDMFANSLRLLNQSIQERLADLCGRVGR